MRDLQRLARAIDAVDERIGRAVAWLALAMVLVQLLVVVLRYGLGSIVVRPARHTLRTVWQAMMARAG